MNEDIVYVPSRVRDESPNLQIEIRMLADGRRALPTYTSLKALVSACGQQQPWVALDHRGMTQVQDATNYDVALINPPKASTAAPMREQEDAEPGDHFPRSWLHQPHAVSKRARK